MKPLFAFIFTAILTVAVCADQRVYAQARYSSVYEAPLSYPLSNSTVTTISDNVFMSEPVATSVYYAVAKPTDRGIAIPQPIGPLLPIQEKPLTGEETVKTVRGQLNTVDMLSEYLAEPPPVAQGPVEEAIDSKVLGSPPESEFDSSGFAGTLPAGIPPQNNSPQANSTEPTPVDPLGYGVLLATIAITTAGLIYMVFVAYDYRQRWMQSLSAQNDRYLGGGAFDREMEDTHNIGLSEGFGLPRHSI